MAYRTRIKYTSKQKAEMWDRWQRGESLKEIGRAFDRDSSSIYGQLSPTGGIRPAPRRRSSLSLTLSEREEISRGIAAQQSMRWMAVRLNRSPSTISREINRHGGLDDYRASHADKEAWNSTRRPKACKLACNSELRDEVADKLRQNWSPEQIAGWLKREHPGDEGNQVSHETIYRTLYIQARGALKKELLQHLRSERTIRRSIHSSQHGGGRGKIVNAISISERPASAEDRAVPGHWEGDLIAGSNNSYIATLVERHTRYVMLAKVSDRKTETVIPHLFTQGGRLPEIVKGMRTDRRIAV